MGDTFFDQADNKEVQSHRKWINFAHSWTVAATR